MYENYFTELGMCCDHNFFVSQICVCKLYIDTSGNYHANISDQRFFEKNPTNVHFFLSVTWHLNQVRSSRPEVFYKKTCS